MPDHVHLLVSEPKEVPLSQAIQILKQRFSKTRPESEVWESRYYDFNVKSEDKRAGSSITSTRTPSAEAWFPTPADRPWSSHNHLDPNTPGPIHLTHPNF